MAFSITDWNINPNRNWYVVISDTGSEINVNLYTTQADAEADTNLVASGVGSYGTNSQIILVMEDAGTPDISLFNSDLDYHITVTGISGDTTKLLHIAPFVDLDEISDGIYQSTTLIQERALYEINLHTHSVKIRSIDLAGPYPAVCVGDVLGIQSDRMSLDVMSIVTETVITGTPDSLTMQAVTNEYVDMVYNG